MHARAGERTPQSDLRKVTGAGGGGAGVIVLQLTVGKARPSQGEDGMSINADGFFKILSEGSRIRQ